VSSTPAAEIERRAGLSPEEPFLFFRDPRGHFAWWSWRSCLQALDSREGGEPRDSSEATGFLVAATDAPAAAVARAGRLLRLMPSPAGSTRPVWISQRPLDHEAERTLAVAALLGGWAVVREPSGSGAGAWIFAWARPTLLSGTGRELAELLAALERQAPRWGRRRWLRRHLRRLDTVWIEPGGEGSDDLSERFDALGVAPRLLSFPSGRW